MFVFLKKISPLFLIILIGIGVHLYNQKDIYVKGNEIKILQFSDLSGFNAKRTEKFNFGIESYFKKINDKGGINGRKVVFLKVDNKGEEDISLDKIYELKNSIVSFFGFIDFCSSKRVLEMIADENRPFLMPFCASDFLKKDYKNLYYSIIPSIEDEIKTLLEYLKQKGSNSFWIVYEDDICMRSLVNKVELISKELKLEIEKSLCYKKNAYLFSDIYKKFENFSPKAVLILGSYKEISIFLKNIFMKKKFEKTLFMIPSYIGMDAFLESIEDNEDLSFIFSEPIFSPLDESYVAKEYRKIFKEYYPNKKFGFDSFKGFLYAKIFSLALGDISKNLSGKRILNFLKNIPYIKYNREHLIKILNKNGMLNKVYLFKYKNKKIFTIK